MAARGARTAAGHRISRHCIRRDDPKSGPRIQAESKRNGHVEGRQRHNRISLGGRPLTSFVWRCLKWCDRNPVPHLAHRTGQVALPHPALGQHFTPSPTARRAQAGTQGGTSPIFEQQPLGCLSSMANWPCGTDGATRLGIGILRVASPHMACYVGTADVGEEGHEIGCLACAKTYDVDDHARCRNMFSNRNF